MSEGPELQNPASGAVPAGSKQPGSQESRDAHEPRGWRGGLRRFRARWLALLGVTLIALYLCWLMVEPFVEVLLWAMVLTIVFYPVRNYLFRRTRHASWAAALSCLLVVAVIVVPVGLVSVAVFTEASDAADYVHKNAPYLLGRDTKVFRFLSKYIVDLDRLGMREYLINTLQRVSGGGATTGAAGAGAAGAGGDAVTGGSSVEHGIGDVISKLLPNAAKFLPGIVGAVLVRVLEVIFILLTMYYLFRDGDRVQAALLDALPLERAQSERIFDRTREVIGASVYGVLVIATIQAILGGLAFAVLGLPSPLLWAVVMFFLSMIPMAGSFIVWVPAAAFLLLGGHWVRAIVLAAWCAGVVGMIDNVLRPRLVGKRTHLHELLIFFSVLGGLQVFGMVGLAMGPVVVAITLALVDVFRKADRPAATDEPTLIEQQAALRDVPDETKTATGTRGTGSAAVAVELKVPSPAVVPEPSATPAAPVTVAGPRLGEPTEATALPLP